MCAAKGSINIKGLGVQASAKSSSADARLSFAANILSQEQAGISQAAQALDAAALSAALELILSLSPQGRLVVAGIGKTGFIGMKLSATFASIGVPSFFLHPTEAMHGDLGRLSPDDVLLVLSHSGETPELTGFLPFVKKRGVKILALTAHADSSLGRLSDVCLAVGKLPEAGPLGLAPTTSTTVLLALGDALAMSVLNERPIERQHFAGMHPGGALGRSLLLVSEVMRSGEKLCVVSDQMKVAQVLEQITLTKGRPGAAVIVDAQGILAGVFTDGDLRRCLTSQPQFLERPISFCMGKNPKTIGAQVYAEEALAVLRQHAIDQVIVIDENRKPIGLVDIQDLL
jgi:arabinose-5-phosphate isomerase